MAIDTISLKSLVTAFVLLFCVLFWNKINARSAKKKIHKKISDEVEPLQYGDLIEDDEKDAPFVGECDLETWGIIDNPRKRKYCLPAVNAVNIETNDINNNNNDTKKKKNHSLICILYRVQGSKVQGL